MAYRMLTDIPPKLLLKRRTRPTIFGKPCRYLFLAIVIDDSEDFVRRHRNDGKIDRVGNRFRQGKVTSPAISVAWGLTGMIMPENPLP